jgi:hypothetical protein
VTASSGDYDETSGIPLDLKSVGCSDHDGDRVSFAEVRNPPEFNWWGSYAREAAPLLVLTAANLAWGLWCGPRIDGFAFGRSLRWLSASPNPIYW